MKLRKQPHGPTRAFRSEEASIVVEAALVLPLFLFVLLFLICLVKVSVVQMALQDAAAQTVRQVSAHMYPAALAAETGDADLQAASTSTAPLSKIGPLAAQLGKWLPAPAGPLLTAASEGDWKPAVDMAASKLGGTVMEPLVRKLSADSVLSDERISLGRLFLPDLRSRKDAFFGLELHYAFPLRLPFTRQTLTLRASAEERVWISDPLSAQSNTAESDSKLQKLEIIGIEPTPLRPGRKAKLIAKTDPGGTVSLSVEYKSGSSKAKHLGEATADSDGIVTWEWLVSGNTTPGTWELIVSAGEGIQKGMMFEVRKER